jgi:hypothetical protein
VFIALFDAIGSGRILGLFFHVVHGYIGNGALDGNGMSDVIGKADLIALDVPGAAVTSVENELVGTATRGQSTGDAANFGLGLTTASRILGTR